MKKLLLTMLISGLISFLFGNYVFNVYKNNIEEAIKSASSLYETVYFMQYGSYKNKNDATSNKLDNYLLTVEDGFYKVYIGITKNKENADIIEGIYKEMGNDIYIKEKRIDNLEFLEILSSYDGLLNTKSNEEILGIQKIIIEKYKELVLNE